MTLIGLLVTLIVIGLILWLVNTLPLDGKIKVVIHVIVVIFLILWLASSVGFLNEPIILRR